MYFTITLSTQESEDRFLSDSCANGFVTIGILNVFILSLFYKFNHRYTRTCVCAYVCVWFSIFINKVLSIGDRAYVDLRIESQLSQK